MKTFCCRIAAALTLFVGGLRAETAASQPTVSIVTDAAPSQIARHGMDKIVAALKDKRVPFEWAASLEAAKGKVLVVAGLANGGDAAATLLKGSGRSVPKRAESLAIQKVDWHGKPAWVIGGSDERGLMYGELDVADRIGWSDHAGRPLSEARETVEEPDAGTRGMTLFAMNRAYWESRFYDQAYWQRYFDTLAQNRFNSVVVVFGYEDGGFLAPCYPYFFDLPNFPDVKMIGITPAQQKQNVEALHRLMAMAHARGIQFTVGIWDHIYRGGVQAGGAPGGSEGVHQPKPSLVWGVTGGNLIPYNQAALKTFLTEFQDIDGIQFRMHDESGLKLDEQGPFWKAIFQTIRETSPKMPLDLRAKGLTANEIQSALDAGLNFRISTKYCMEQMGLPFHPMHINPADQASRRHSYADLLVYPRKYQMHWQLWNGGTARILLWGDPEYARRFVESTHLYDGDGFEVDEPLATKMEAQPQDSQSFDLLKPSARYYDYEFERYWHFFQVFGRIGYNTNAPAEIWDREFEIRFGPKAAPLLEKALHRASWILPRIISSSYPYGSFPMTTGWPEKQRLGDLPYFARATLTDVQLFENFDEEAQLLIQGGETAKVRPAETSRWFAQTAEEIRALLAQAEKKIGRHRSKEYASTVLDLKILANLALYHSRRIPAAVSYRLYDRTKDPGALDDAMAQERSAIAAWRQIVDAAGDAYAGDLIMGARSRHLCGHWRDELTALELGLADLDRQRKLVVPGTNAPAPRFQAVFADFAAPIVVHQPVATAPALKPLTIRAQARAASGIKWVRVLYRSVNQTRDYETLAMQPVDEKGNYQAVIPAEKIDPQFDFMYLLQAMDNQHHGVIHPDFGKQTPYFVVRLQR